MAARPPTRTEEPKGLAYEAELVTPEEERELLQFLGGLDFDEVVMRGQTARRTVLHFGYRYDYETWKLVPSEQLPPLLVPVRDRAAKLAGVEPEEFVQALVTRYPVGAPIGWHRDAPAFGLVAGVSLGATSRLRFQRRAGETRLTYEAELAPRSAYVLSGAARWSWQHSIPPTKELRYSITFRTLREEREK